MGNELSTKTYPSGKVVSSFKLSKTGSKADSLAGSMVVVSSLSECDSAASTAPTTPDHTTDSYRCKYQNVTLQQTSTNQPPGNRTQGNMGDEQQSQTVNQTLPSAEAYDKNEIEERRNAAIVLQKHYRGHRTRRQLAGFSLSPENKWLDTIEQAKFHKFADPKAEHARLKEAENPVGESSTGKREMSPSRLKWERALYVAKMAQKDYSDDEPEDDSEADSDAEHETNSSSASGKLGNKEVRMMAKKKVQKDRNLQSKMMDLQYFLEMVDAKHRYGSNLRPYHEYWQTQDTKENFFYWLDVGAGKHVDLGVLPRTQLESERIKYLNREQRKKYLVKVDEEGRLCWAKDGKRINTYGKYVDTVDNGVVPLSEAPEDDALLKSARPTTSGSDTSDSSSSSSDSGTSDSEEAERYVDPGPKKKGVKKIVHVSPATILNRLLRKTTKSNTWIFVADMNFRLYVGIKKSGTFQHSSFLHGARVAAAGLIKIRDGKLTSISPLSGHYRPPAANFRLFIKALHKEGVDMKHVRISKSYAVLVGLEAYGKFTQTKKKAEQHQPLKSVHKKKKEIGDKQIIDSKREATLADDEASSSHSNKKTRGRRNSKGKRAETTSGVSDSSPERPSTGTSFGDKMRGLFHYHHHSHSGGKEESADQNALKQTQSHGSHKLGGFLRRYSASKASVHSEQSHLTTTTIHETEQSQQTTVEPTKIGLGQQGPHLTELAGNMENLRVMDEHKVVGGQSSSGERNQPASPAKVAPEVQGPGTDVGADGNDDGGGTRF